MQYNKDQDSMSWFLGRFYCLSCGQANTVPCHTCLHVTDGLIDHHSQRVQLKQTGRSRSTLQTLKHYDNAAKWYHYVETYLHLHLTICLATQNLAKTNSDQVSIPRPSAERVYLSNLNENGILYVH